MNKHKGMLTANNNSFTSPEVWNIYLSAGWALGRHPYNNKDGSDANKDDDNDYGKKIHDNDKDDALDRWLLLNVQK